MLFLDRQLQHRGIISKNSNDVKHSCMTNHPPAVIWQITENFISEPDSCFHCAIVVTYPSSHRWCNSSLKGKPNLSLFLLSIVQSYFSHNPWASAYLWGLHINTRAPPCYYHCFWSLHNNALQITPLIWCPPVIVLCEKSWKKVFFTPYASCLRPYILW